MTVTLVLVGLSAVGKSTVARTLGSMTARPVVEIGDLVRAEAATRSDGLEPLDLADRTFAAGDVLHFVTQAASIALTERPCIVVGPRRPEELAYLLSDLWPATSVGLVVPHKIRKVRRAQKLALPRFLSDAQGVHRDTIEQRWGIGETLARVDHTVDASASPRSVAGAVLTHWLTAAEMVGGRQSR